MNKLPILADNIDLQILFNALKDEVGELETEVLRTYISARIPDRDNAVRETLDVIQLGIDILAALEQKYGADIPALMDGHVQKLLRRGWVVERYIKIDWRGNDEADT